MRFDMGLRGTNGGFRALGGFNYIVLISSQPTVKPWLSNKMFPAVKVNENDGKLVTAKGAAPPTLFTLKTKKTIYKVQVAISTILFSLLFFSFTLSSLVSSPGFSLSILSLSHPFCSLLLSSPLSPYCALFSLSYLHLVYPLLSLTITPLTSSLVSRS